MVKAGQIIAELDRTNLISELSSAQANLKSSQSELDYQKTNYERFKALHDKGLISANDYEQARLSYIKAQQTVTHQKESVKKAQTNLGYATITSPIDGVVLKKEVEEGQTVLMGGMITAITNKLTRSNQNMAFLTLEVRESNAPARALYAKHGYRDVGRRKNYYEKPREDAILMTKELEA